MIGRDRFGRDCQDALPAGRELLDTPVRSAAAVKGPLGVADALASRHAEQTLRRALDVDEPSPVVVMVQGRHEAVLGLEGNGVRPRVRVALEF